MLCTAFQESRGATLHPLIIHVLDVTVYYSQLNGFTPFDYTCIMLQSTTVNKNGFTHFDHSKYQKSRTV